MNDVDKDKNKVFELKDFKKSDLKFDKKKVDLRTLKDLISAGLYNPSAEKIAESLLENEVCDVASKENSEEAK